jgi:hypothetical protein
VPLEVGRGELSQLVAVAGWIVAGVRLDTGAAEREVGERTDRDDAGRRGESRALDGQPQGERDPAAGRLAAEQDARGGMAPVE